MGVATPRLCQGGSYEKTYYQLAVRDPGAVAWYCALKLEMATALTAALLTEQLRSDDVPGLGDAQRKIEAELVSRTGLTSPCEAPLTCAASARSTTGTWCTSGARGASSTRTWPSG